jgi:iron complex outermembrane receptor protein
MKSRYLMSCAVAAVLSGAAHAAPAVQSPDSPAATTPDASGDIIVTATRRSESIQKVPLTIQAFTGDTLAQLNVKNFGDLLKYTPNVTLGNNGPGAGAIFLRGLSTGFAGTQSAATTGYFPNVALYLDDQSMQFPGRNADVYVADLERVEVLEGPQGTLFGGGAQAGAVRYITNKPKLDKFEGHFEGTAGGTVGGAPNGSFNAMINLPVVQDKLAVRAVIYDDHHGGYIDNVPGTFTRSDFDHYNNYLNNGGKALPPTQQSNLGQYNNNELAKKDFNSVDYIGGRLSAKWQISDDWDALVSESYQKLDTDGTFNTQPYSDDFQKLGKLQTTVFSPSYNKDEFWNTAWTVNGQIGDFLKVVYTGAYMVRHLETQQDYSNYSRAFGSYYQCTGGSSGWGTGPAQCYSPTVSWHDKVRNTHLTNELRISTPDDKRIRAIGGAYYEKFRIYDNMDFNYKTIPTCTADLIAANTAAAAAGLPTSATACAGLVQTNPNSTANQPGPRGPGTAFGEDVQRGYDQYAFFGSVDFDILHNLTLTAGTRYYHYRETETGSQFQTTTSSCYNVLVCSYTGSGDVDIDAKGDKVIYTGFKSRASLTWKPTSHTTIYGTFSQGFRPGGFNRTDRLILPDANGVPQLNRPNGYKPDTLTNWELGVKTDLFNHKVQLNLSAYHMIWQNVQIGFFNPAGGFGNTAFVTNGANFHVNGFEAQLVARPMTGVNVQAGFTYNDSKQVTSPCLISDQPASLTFGQCITTQLKGGQLVGVQAPFGDKGSSLPFAPHVQANLRLRYDWAGAAELKWFVSGGVSYTGATYNQPNTYPSGEVASASATVGPNGVLIPGTTLLRYRMPGYAQLDAQIGVHRDAWSVSIFGENLANSHASTFTSSVQFIKSETVLRPMTYGLKIGYDF